MTYSHLWNKYFKIHDLQLSALKGDSKLFEILLVKILLILLVTKYIRQLIEQINFFLSSRKQPHVLSDWVFSFRVDVEKTKHAFQ